MALADRACFPRPARTAEEQGEAMNRVEGWR
jgi:hypothetical protein